MLGGLTVPEIARTFLVAETTPSPTSHSPASREINHLRSIFRPRHQASRRRSGDPLTTVTTRPTAQA
jgi:predicted RNA polymerase sigma factor